MEMTPNLHSSYQPLHLAKYANTRPVSTFHVLGHGIFEVYPGHCNVLEYKRVHIQQYNWYRLFLTASWYNISLLTCPFNSLLLDVTLYFKQNWMEAHFHPASDFSVNFRSSWCSFESEIQRTNITQIHEL